MTRVQKVIPEKIISSCNECLSWHESQDWLDREKIPCKGELVSGGKIPPDCPLKDYQPERKPRESLQWFIEQMEHTLKDNDYKGGWERCSQDWLLARLIGEVGELALHRAEGENERRIIKECTDVANFAMMIADNLRFIPEPKE